jgi:hypothetical protein
MTLWRDIYLVQLGFHPVGAVGRLVQKWERDSYIQKEKQDTKQHRNTEYKKQKANIQNKEQT